MAFDINKMKADGVSSHLIELAELSERDDTAAFEKIAMGIENTQIFRDFITMESDAPVWDYMYAAGLCTRYEADWLKDPNNPYIDTNTVTLTAVGEGFGFKRTATDETEEYVQGGQTIVIPKGTTLYLNAANVSLHINDEGVAQCDSTYRPYIFTEDSTVAQEPSEC